MITSKNDKYGCPYTLKNVEGMLVWCPDFTYTHDLFFSKFNTYFLKDEVQIASLPKLHKNCHSITAPEYSGTSFFPQDKYQPIPFEKSDLKNLIYA